MDCVFFDTPCILKKYQIAVNSRLLYCSINTTPHAWFAFSEINDLNLLYYIELTQT